MTTASHHRSDDFNELVRNELKAILPYTDTRVGVPRQSAADKEIPEHPIATFDESLCKGKWA